jgi:integrase
MSVFKRGNIYHVRAQVGGVMIARSTKSSNKRIAEQLEAKWISEVHAEVVIAGRKPVTLEKAITAFLAARRGTAGYGSCEIKLRAWQPFYKQMMHEISAADIHTRAIELVEDEGYSVNTINVSIIYYNAIQNFCAASGFTPGVKAKRLKGSSNRVRFLTDAEVTKLLETLNPNNGVYREKRKAQDNYDFTVMLLNTGAREQEIATLKLSQIDTVAGTITINRSKGGNDTTLKMSNAVIEVIARRQVAAEQPLPEGQSLHGRAGEGYLFPERSRARYNNEFMGIAAARIGLEDVCIHTMRHTYACKMLRAGVSLPELQHLLGHKNLTSTMVYSHLVPNLTADRAAAVLNA